MPNNASGIVTGYQNEPFLVSVSEPVIFLSVVPASRTTKNNQTFIEQRTLHGHGQDVGSDYSESLDNRVIGAKILSSKNKASTLELTLWNEDLKLLGASIMQKGSIIQIAWGYSGYISRTRRFRVYKVKGSRARVSNFGQLTILAKGQSFDFNQKPKSRKFSNTTPVMIARRIAKDYGFLGNSIQIGQEDFSANRTYLQVNQTDAQFLTSLAKKIGWTFSCEDDFFVFYPTDKAEKDLPIAHYDYFSDDTGWLKRFEPTTNIVESIGSITVKSRDPESGKAVSYTANVANRKSRSMGQYVEALPTDTPGYSNESTKKVHRDRSPSSAGVIPSGIVIHKPDATASQVKQEAQARQVNRQLFGIKARCLVVGDPDLWANKIISLGNLGAGLDGYWRIVSSKHILDSRGYEVELVVRKDALDSLGSGVKAKSTQKAKSKNVVKPPTTRIKQNKTDLSEAQTGAKSKTRYSRR